MKTMVSEVQRGRSGDVTSSSPLGVGAGDNKKTPLLAGSPCKDSSLRVQLGDIMRCYGAWSCVTWRRCIERWGSRLLVLYARRLPKLVLLLGALLLLPCFCLFTMEWQQDATIAREVLTSWRQVTPARSGSTINTTVCTSAPGASRLHLCPPVPPNLKGPYRVWGKPPSLEQLERRFPQLQPGGAWRPTHCRARHRVAVVVPFRDRAQHLSVLLYSLHPLLQRQQLDYRIVVVEQAGTAPLNKGMLMNVGFEEALKMYGYQCFIFHDVDLIPEDDRNLYTCSKMPRHMSVGIDIFKYRLPYFNLFGGVCAISKIQFQKANGFSNMFWGWGGEDDDMRMRIGYLDSRIARYPIDVARYQMLLHRKRKPSPDRYKMLWSGGKRFKKDGLNSLRYIRKKLVLYSAYTYLLVQFKSAQEQGS